VLFLSLTDIPLSSPFLALNCSIYIENITNSKCSVFASSALLAYISFQSLQFLLMGAQGTLATPLPRLLRSCMPTPAGTFCWGKGFLKRVFTILKAFWVMCSLRKDKIQAFYEEFETQNTSILAF